MPSDASHAMGRPEIWDCATAKKALRLTGRRRIISGNLLATNPQQMARIIVDQLSQQTGLVILEIACDEKDTPLGLPRGEPANHFLMKRPRRESQALCTGRQFERVSSHA